MEEILIISNYYPPEKGAAANRIEQMALKLHQNNYNVTVLCPLGNYPKGELFPEYKGKFSITEKIQNITLKRLWIYPSNSSNIFNGEELPPAKADPLDSTYDPNEDLVGENRKPYFAFHLTNCEFDITSGTTAFESLTNAAPEMSSQLISFNYEKIFFSSCSLFIVQLFQHYFKSTDGNTFRR